MDKEFLNEMIQKSMKQAGMGQTPDDYYAMGSQFLIAGMNDEDISALSSAMYCFEVAAEKGHAGAQGSLSTGLMSGMGIEKNMERAEHWAKKAAEQGDSNGMLGMGICCFHRDEYDNAEFWLKKAMDAGNPEAKVMLEQLAEMKQVFNKFKNIQ
jgi:TPR repeat protein